jgi:hypothetical protein
MDTRSAREARQYLLQRGVFDWVIERCPVLGYMPDGKDLSWRQWADFDALFRVTEPELVKERQWYHDHVNWEVLNDEHLSFLSTPRSFAIRLGVLNEKGAYRLSSRLVFSCKNGKGETRFYQSRVLSYSSKSRSKFLNPPGMKKYPFMISMQMLALQGEQVWSHMPGTLITESPFGPLVACSWSLCLCAIATLGESSPSVDQLAGSPEPIWLGQDNDEPQVKVQEGRGKRIQRVSFPGEKQAQIHANFFAQQGQEFYRLRPWKYPKGMDEWISQEGIQPVVETMRQILAQRQIA